MGYLDNSSITVDAILTKRGRELLSGVNAGNSQFLITQFALSDDEIDYSLFNESHPNGTQYAAEAIENMSLIEAIPNGANSMNSKLITLTRGQNAIPYLQPSINTVGANGEFQQGDPLQITITTKNFNGTGTTLNEEYVFTFTDSRLLSTENGFLASGGAIGTVPTSQYLDPYSTVAFSISVQGTTINMIATMQDTDLFPSTGSQRTASLIVEGITSGARVVVPITVTAN